MCSVPVCLCGKFVCIYMVCVCVCVCHRKRCAIATNVNLDGDISIPIFFPLMGYYNIGNGRSQSGK